jgi:hypothetical protein
LKGILTDAARKRGAAQLGIWAVRDASPAAGAGTPSFALMQRWAIMLGVSIDIFDTSRVKKAAE